MDRIEFRRVSEMTGISSHSIATLHPAINGHLLRDLAAAVEIGEASRDDRALVGAYAARPVAEVAWPSRHFLDRPEPGLTWFADADPILLGCVCGDAGCWPLTAKIAIEPGMVTWSHFRNGHRDWDLSGLGPFRFAHSHYLAALRKSGSVDGGTPRPLATS